MKKLIIPIVVGLTLTAGIRLCAGLPSQGPTIWSIIVLPFYVIGGLVSGSIHAPNEIAIYAAMFAFFFLLALLVQVAWYKLKR